MADKPTSKINVAKLKASLVNFLVPLICLGISAGLFLFVIYPAIQSIPTLEQELSSKTTLDIQLTTKVAGLKKLVDFKSSVDENAVLLNDVLVSEAMVPQLLTQVDLIAKENGLDVKSLGYSVCGSATPAGAKSNLTQIVIGLSGSSTYDQLTSFSSAIENAGRIVNIDNYRYTTADGGIVDFVFSLSSPYLFVQSNAVTDDPINLDISSKDFVSLVNKIKTMRIYKPTIDEISKIIVIETTESTASQPTL